VSERVSLWNGKCTNYLAMRAPVSDVDTQVDREDNFSRSFQAEVGHVKFAQTSFKPALLDELVVLSAKAGLVIFGFLRTRTTVLFTPLLHPPHTVLRKLSEAVGTSLIRLACHRVDLGLKSKVIGE
jgi:hypothetical protein